MTVSGMSTRLTDLPISFQSLGSLSFTSFGGSSFAAAPATLPKLTLRLLGAWVMTPFAAEHSDAGTPHCCAAAAISISRAVAPPRRDRARDADRGGGAAVGRAGVRMLSRKRRHHPRAEQA